MARRIFIGNVRILDTKDPYHNKGVVLVKNYEYYYSRFRRIICFENGILVNNKSQALEDYDFLTQNNQSPERLLYMEENINSYLVSNKEFNKKIKVMKKVKKENEKRKKNR